MPAANAARPGAILAAERQRQGLSIEDVSNRLRFRPYQIEAIEREDYSKLPQGAFLRGFVKNYARLLALNPDRLLAALEEHLQEDQTPRIDVPTQNIRYDPQAKPAASPAFKGVLIALGVLLLLFAATYWWFFMRADATGQTIRPRAPRSADVAAGADGAASSRPAALSSPAADAAPPANTGTGLPSADSPTPAQSSPAPTVVPSESAAGGSLKPAETSASTSAAAPVAGPPVPAPPTVPAVAAIPATASSSASKPEPAAVKPEPVGPAKPVVNEPQSVVALDSTGGSWVRIRDRRGRVVHEQLHSAGSSLRLNVEGPVSFVIGDAKNARLRFKGRDIDLARHTDVNVARLTLED